MRSYGNTGSGGAGGVDREQLNGVTASDTERAVYPEQDCLQCIREFERSGRETTPAQCLHRHWRVADEDPTMESRDSLTEHATKEE